MPNKSDPVVGRKAEKKNKRISSAEKAFTELMVYENMGCINAARQAFGWACEPKSSTSQKAVNLSRTPRVRKYRLQLEQALDREVTAQQVLHNTSDIEYDSLRQFIYRRLEKIRDDTNAPGSSRFKAISALEKMIDPSADINLILMWIDIMWTASSVHCPCCHASFALNDITNARLNKWRKDLDFEPEKTIDSLLDRRMTVLKRADNRRTPHPHQVLALEAPERYVVGLGPARCLEENERIVLSDGSFIPIKELKGTMFEVPAFGVLGAQVPAKAYAEDNGIKPVFRITTEAGRSVVRTEEHPFLWSKKIGSGQGTRTQVGSVEWKELKYIKPGDLVAVPTELNLKHSNTRRYSDDEIKLLGYLLGDGGTTQGVYFTQLEGKVKEEFKTVVNNLGCEITATVSAPLTIRVRGKKTKTGFDFNNVLERVRTWGINCLARNKRLPHFVWQFSNSELGLLLNRLYACDGYAIAKGEIGITLASERMIRDIEMACLRLGINGRVRARTVNLNSKKFKAWAFDITKKEDVLKFIDKVGIFGKEEQLEKTRVNAVSKVLSQHWETSGLPSGYMWRVVKSIEYEGEKPTVSIFVDTYNTFLTTFVEHNSGKSKTIAYFSLLSFLIPGAESWILARVYGDASTEVEYLDSFLNTLFFPYTKHIITRRFDSKTEELILESKWGSVLRVKSAKSRGSISARELELAAIAEPGWVPDDIFNHLRARVVSRLGRIVLFGTPQGFGGILGRFVNMIGHDDKGRAKRISTDERRVSAGCPWNVSLFKYQMSPEMNPEYVTSELAAAKGELTMAEYASEFQGLMASAEGALFSQLSDRHLQPISREQYEKCVWILGVDQGPTNFAALLLGYDGKRVFVANEYFENAANTMRSNLYTLKDLVPAWIRKVGGDPSRWGLTIFDIDPPLWRELDEMEQEGKKWNTEFTFRIKDKKGRWTQENWRRETYEFINVLAMPAEPNIYFDATNCEYLHDQLLRAQVRQDNPSDNTNLTKKGWVITDPVRGDHVADAFVMAVFTILSGQVTIPSLEVSAGDPYDEARKALQYKLATGEKEDLSGYYNQPVKPEEVFEDTFGRKRFKHGNPDFWNYKDY